MQEAVTGELHERILERFPDINEDTMPGELANIIAGRVAAVFDFHGPNYVVDAGVCLGDGQYDLGHRGAREFRFRCGDHRRHRRQHECLDLHQILQDRGPARQAGRAPYSEGADGFVMGEGAALFLLKRLDDAVRDDDRIYAVIRGLGGASDGKGKGITAPNPIGQRLAVERAWERAGLKLAPGDLVEGHGTSTPVGDIVEVESMGEALRGMGLPENSIPLGSVKSNIGHLKGGGRSGRHVEGDPVAVPQNAAAEPRLRQPESQNRLGQVSVLRQHGAPALGEEWWRSAAGWGSAPLVSEARTFTWCWRSTCRGSRKSRAGRCVAVGREAD